MLSTFRSLTVAAATAVAALTAGPTHAEPLKVAYNQWVGFAPLFVAQEKGFFDDAGVEVETVEFAGPGDSMAPLAAGHLDVSLTTADNVVLLSSRSDSPVVIVSMLDMSDGADALVATKGIDGVAGLKGKTVATTIGEVNHLLLLKALESAGLKESDVSLVNMSPDDAGAAFVAGNLDAAVTWEPWVSKAVEADGQKLFTSADAPNLLVDVMAVTKQTLAEREADLKKFLQAMERGVQFISSDPDEAHAIVGKALSVDAAEVAAMLEGVKLYTMSESAELLAPDGGMSQSLAAIAGFLKAQGTIDEAPAADAMVDAELVE